MRPLFSISQATWSDYNSLEAPWTLIVVREGSYIMGIPGYGASWDMYFGQGDQPIEENGVIRHSNYISHEALCQHSQSRNILVFYQKIFFLCGNQALLTWTCLVGNEVLIYSF